MDDRPTIRSPEDLEAWLRGKPDSYSAWIIFRIVARVLPVPWLWGLQRYDLAALPVVRAALETQVRSLGGFAIKLPIQGEHLDFYSKFLSSALHNYQLFIEANGKSIQAWRSSVEHEMTDAMVLAATQKMEAGAARFISNKTMGAIRTHRLHVAEGKESPVEDVVQAENLFWTNLEHDCVELENSGSLEGQQLWLDGENYFWDDWQKIVTYFDRKPEENANWDFWVQWYQRLLKGEALDPELLRQIAQIDQNFWDAGPEAVADVIKHIEMKHELLREVKQLKADLERHWDNSNSQIRMGHNNPPTELEDHLENVPRITIVWEALNASEGELEKAEPDVSVLRKCANVLRDWSIAVAKYCVGLGDAALKSGAAETGKTLGKWGPSAAAAYYAAQTEPVRSFAGRLFQLVELLAK